MDVTIITEGSHWFESESPTFQGTECCMSQGVDGWLRMYWSSKENTDTFKYLNIADTHKCTVMFLFNLAEQDWLSIPCDKKPLCHVICHVENATYGNKELRNINTDQVKDYSFCSRDSMLFQNYCHVFNWLNKIDNDTKLCKINKARPVGLETVLSYNELFQSLSLENKFPPLLVPYCTTTAHKVTFQRILSKLNFIINHVKISQARGFYPCLYNKVNIIIGLNLYQCKHGGYILSENVCDGIADCPNDKSDEEITANNSYCDSVSKTCSTLNLKTANGKCQKYISTENTIEVMNENINEKYNPDNYFCKNDKVIHNNHLDDLTFDCGASSEDEPILMSLQNDDIYALCKQPDMIPCMEGHSRCYYINKICNYKLNSHHHLIPGRNGGHLQKCRTFECNVMFKCF